MLRKNPEVSFSKSQFLPINMDRILWKLFSPGYCCPSPTSSVKIASLSILGSVPYLWALFGCRDLPNLIPSFSSFPGHSCSFCYKTVAVRSTSSLRLAQIKNEGVSSHSSRARSKRKHTQQELNLGSRKPSLLINFSGFLLSPLGFSFLKFIYLFIYLPLRFEKWPL